MAVSYKITDGSFIGVSDISASDSSAAVNLGTIVKGVDTSTNAYGEAEFIYVKFTGTVAAGDFVVWDRAAKTCTASPTSATNGNFGISMAAQTTAHYGWVMVRGVHDGANVTTGKTSGTQLTGSATAGRASSAVANYILETVFAKNTAASNVGTVEIFYPTCSGR